MQAKLIDQTDNKLTIQVTIELTGQMCKRRSKSVPPGGRIKIVPL